MGFSFTERDMIIIVIILSFLLIPRVAITLLHASMFSHDVDLSPVSRCDYRKRWFYTLNEIKVLYEKEYRKGERLENFVRIENGKAIAYWMDAQFAIPEKFIKTTLKHLEKMLEKGCAKYIFRLDACHSHLFISNESFFKKYEKLTFAEMIKTFIKDESLGALYHNAEHLALRKPPKTGKIDPVAENLIKKRNIIGWYDGRPLEFTYPKPSDPIGHLKANTAGIPESYCGFCTINFKANKNGEFIVRHGGQEIRIDISFCDHYYH